MSVITIDFHNTLVECDPWFELEVRTLVSEVMRWAAEHEQASLEGIDLGALDRSYRELRLEIHEHGMEVAAVEATHQILAREGVSLPDDVVDRAVAELMLAALDEAKPVRGAQEMLSHLERSSTRLAVVSSAVHHQFLEWALTKLDMRTPFETVCTSASTGFYKSRPEIYLETLKHLDADPRDALHLGDSIRFDVGGAAAAGMHTAWFDRNEGRPTPDGIPAPDLVVTDLSSAAQSLLDTLNRKRNGD